MELLTGSILALLSIEDIRKQKLPAVVCFLLLICNEIICILSHKNFEILLPNMLGIFFVLIAIVTKEAIGLGDTIILWGCFLVINIKYMLLFMICVFFIIFLISIPYLLILKMHNKPLPFLPIIYISYCYIQVASWSNV